MNDFEQIPFELPYETGSKREDLIEAASNQKAVDLIDQWPDWPGTTVILAGPTGSGKSHLAKVWAANSGAHIVKADDLTRDTATGEQMGNIVIENVRSGVIDENALFHLINRTRAHEHHLLITSRSWPQGWELTLPDLISRIRSAVLVELAEPDDLLLKQMIHKHFSDRQVQIAPAVVDYLVVRMERSLDAAKSLVVALDREALSRRAPITRPLASQVLKRLQDGGSH